jgi:hypothetical protein
MVKYFFIIVVLFVAGDVSAADLIYLGQEVGPGGTSSHISSYLPSPTSRSVIYDDQTYYTSLLTAGFVITAPSKVADDFEVDGDWTLEMIRVWLLGAYCDTLVEVFGDSGAGPDDADLLFSETVDEADQTWTFTGDSWVGYPIVEVDVPISGFVIGPGARYWLSLQAENDGVTRGWAGMYHNPEYWDMCYGYYGGTWIASYYLYGLAYDCFFELHGTPVEYNDPEITETFPHDSDFPSGVPVNTDVTFHVTDDISGCDTGETTCDVEEGGAAVPGTLDWDDADPLDVAFTWTPDAYYPEGASIDVEVVTYDLAGNGPVTEDWSFTTGYVNIAPESLGVIKARFAR